MCDDRRARLAILGGFPKLAAKQPFGTNHAAHAMGAALIRSERFRYIDIYVDEARRMRMLHPTFGVEVPKSVSVSAYEAATLPFARDLYHAVYVSEGHQFDHVSAMARPLDDWAPVVYDFGTTHSPRQWARTALLALSGALRQTDTFIVKCAAQAQLFRETWSAWNERQGWGALPRIDVVPNGIDVHENRRSPELGRSARALLGLGEGDAMFLAFSKLTKHTKGDQQALVALWREVKRRCPRAFLVLAGAAPETCFPLELEAAARAFGVADRVVVIGSPYEVFPRAKTALMSAADAFVHLTTGTEEAMPLAVLEAMAHQLPVVATNWSGLREVIAQGEDGFLVDTLHVPVPDEIRFAHWGYNDVVHCGEVSRSASFDPKGLLDAVTRLARERDRAEAMGQRARETVLARFELSRVVARRIACIDEVSRAAEARWRGAPPRRQPLVDADAALRALAVRRLEPGDRLRLADAEIVEIMPYYDDRSRRLMAAACEALAGVPSRSAGELCAAMMRAAGDASDLGDEAWRASARVLLRLLSHHAIALAPDSGEAIPDGQPRP